MATLAKVVEKYRKSGAGAFGALGSGIKEKTKEFVDPRRLIFKEGGLLTSMFPGLKPYKAKGPDSPDDTGSVSGLGSSEPILQSIDLSSKISAKNSLILKSIARDMFLTKENIIKLTKEITGTAREKAGDWEQRQEAREAAFEEKFKNLGKQTGKGSKIEKVSEKEKDGKNGGLLSNLMNPKKMINDMLGEGLMGTIVRSFAGFMFSPVGLGILAAAGIGTFMARASKESHEAANKVSGAADLSSESKTMLDVHAQTSDIERRKMNLLANRPSNKKSMLFWKDSQMQKDYLNEIGFDESTGLTAEEKSKGYTGIDAKGQPTTSTSPTKAGVYSSSGTSPDKLSQTGSESEAMRFFQEKGWTQEQAAGIVGNLKAESNFKTDAVGDNGKAYGIAQWHPDRQSKFQELYGKPIQQANFKEQLEYVNWELNNTEKKAGNKLRGAKSATEAASLVDQFYERSTGAHRQKRMEFAAALMGPSTGDKVGKASQEVQVAQRQESSGGGATYNMNTQNTNVSQGKGQQAPAAVASTYDDVFTSLHTSIA